MLCPGVRVTFYTWKAEKTHFERFYCYLIFRKTPRIRMLWTYWSIIGNYTSGSNTKPIIRDNAVRWGQEGKTPFANMVLHNA